MVDHFGRGSLTQMIINQGEHSHVQLSGVGHREHACPHGGHSSAKDVLTIDVPRPRLRPPDFIVAPDAFCQVGNSREKTGATVPHEDRWSHKK